MAVVTQWANCAAVENPNSSQTCRQRRQSTAVFRLTERKGLILKSRTKWSAIQPRRSTSATIPPMRLLRYFLPALLALPLFAQPSVTISFKPGRDANQPVDEEYTGKIREYTTETFFNSPLTDYLPASKTVPTPKAVLGDVAGAPGILPYAAEVYRYMRMLEAATPRVKVFSIGKTEEGREMIAVAVASERLIATLDENRARLAQLADPRTIGLDDAKADSLVAASTPGKPASRQP